MQRLGLQPMGLVEFFFGLGTVKPNTFITLQLVTMMIWDRGKLWDATENTPLILLRRLKNLFSIGKTGGL